MVTISVEPASAHLALEQLGSKLGVKMIPGGSVTQDVIAFRFRDTPTDVILSRIAKGVNAEWQRDQAGILILTRTPGQEAAEKAKVTQAMREKVSKELAKLTIPSEKNVDQMTSELQALADLVQRSGDDYYRKAQEFEDKLPIQRLLVRIVKSIPLEDILNLPEDEKASYSLNPTRRQRAFPNGANQFLGEFKKQAELQRQVVEKLGLDDRFPNYYIPAFQQNFGATDDIRIKLIMERQVFGGVSFNLVIRSGQYAISKQCFLNVGQNFGVSNDDPNHPLRVMAKGIEEPPKWTPKALEIQKVIGSKFGGKKIEGIDEKPLVDLVTGMPAEEPLAVMVGPLLTQLADVKDVDFVAVIPDMAFFTTAQAGFTENSAGSLEGTLGMLASVMTVEQDGNFLTFGTDDPASVREMRFPRLATANLAKILVKGEEPDFDQIATFVGSTDSDLQFQMSFFLAAAVGPTGMDTFNWLNETALLRIYGRLSNADRQKVKGEGLVINLNAIPPGLVKPIDKLIFGNQTLSSQLQSHDDPPNRYGMIYGEGPDGRETDPFVALGNGFPPNSAARLKMYNRDRIFAKRSKANYSSSQVFSPQDLGQNLAWQETAQYAQYNEAKLDQFAIAQNRELFLDFDFRDRGMIQHSMSVPGLSGATKWGALESLPSDLLAQIKASYEEAKKSYQNMEFRSGGTGSKAP